MRAGLRKVHQPRVASTLFDGTSDPRPAECLIHSRSYMLEVFSVGQSVLICNTHGKTVAEKVSKKNCPRNVVSKKNIQNGRKIQSDMLMV